MNFKRYISLLTAASLLYSCSTTEKLTIKGNPGTTVYTPTKKSLGVIGGDGRLQLEIPSDDYYCYLLTYDKTAGLYVPFGLDIRRNTHQMTKIAVGTGYTLTSIGLATGMTSLLGAALASKDEDDNTSSTLGTIAGIGLAVGGIGAAIGAPADSRLHQTMYKYNISYLDNQRTNEDISFVKPFRQIQADIESQRTQAKPEKPKASSIVRPAATETVDDEAANTPRKALAADKAKVRIGDHASKLEGRYAGSGAFLLKGVEEESYPEIEVELVRVDNNTVEVNVIQNGEPFFAEAALYTIKKGSNGSYTLTNKKVSSATITISSKGALSYNHPRVDIDGTKYTLKIKASR